MKKLVLAIALSLGLTEVSLACQFDTDCSYGSQCVKSGYGMYGVCMGGRNPGNSNDRQPVRNSMNSNDRVGNTCSFDTQCGYGRRCVKSGYSLQGTCY